MDRSILSLLTNSQIDTEPRADERTRTADLISLRVIGQALQGFANAAYLEGFPFPALLRVAPYCVRGGIRVASGAHRSHASFYCSRSSVHAASSSNKFEVA